MDSVKLHGITWGHSRGYTPLVALSQRFNELHPQVEIVWHKRTLQEFADLPLEKMTGKYDLLIIDHPWVGCAAATGSVLPLDEYMPLAFLNEQAVNSVGMSHPSYNYEGRQWALAIDAATPVASYRADLFEKNQAALPGSWSELMALAKRNKVAVPGAPIDLLMNFYMFCLALGTTPFLSDEEVIDANTGLAALEVMAELWGAVDERMFGCNPIAVAELMTATDEFWYCPFAYGYSNYSRAGYARNILHYTDLVSFGNAGKLKSTLGGTGLSISATCSHTDWALKFAQLALSPGIQSTFYVEHGGQPGHRSAWTASLVNERCNNFFRNTLPALDRAYVRPRYNGYLHFQDLAGAPIYRFLKNGGSAPDALNQLNVIYRESKPHIHLIR